MFPENKYFPSELFSSLCSLHSQIQGETISMVSSKNSLNINSGGVAVLEFSWIFVQRYARVRRTDFLSAKPIEAKSLRIYQLHLELPQAKMVKTMELVFSPLYHLLIHLVPWLPFVPLGLCCPFTNITKTQGLLGHLLFLFQGGRQVVNLMN